MSDIDWSDCHRVTYHADGSRSWPVKERDDAK